MLVLNNMVSLSQINNCAMQHLLLVQSHYPIQTSYTCSRTIVVKISKNCKLLEFHFTHCLTTTIYLLPKLLSLCHPFFPGQTNFNLTIFGLVNFCLQYVCFLCVLINTRVPVIMRTLSIKSQAHGITDTYDCGLG